MKDLININRLNRFGQNIWTRIKNTFMTKEDAINGVLVGQQWTLLESVVGNSPIILPSTDSFTELYIEMYSSNGTISHQQNIKIDSILFESSNNEYREILLDSVYDAQTYVRYDFATNSIIPIMYEGNEITDSSNITTRVYTKTNNIEVGNIEAEKIVYDNSFSNVSSNNVQGAIDEVSRTLGSASKNLLKLVGNIGETRSYVGVTVTKIDNNTYTLSGTSTQDTWFEIGYNFHIGTVNQTNNYLELNVNKTYCASVRVNGTINSTKNPSVNFQGTSSLDTVYLTDTLNTSTLNNTSGLKRVYITIPNGTTFNNVTIKLQLEEGTEVTEYEPYVEDVGTRINNMQGAIDEVTRTLGYTVSKNLLKFPYDKTSMQSNGTFNANGIVWTINNDGSVSCSGTSNADESNIVLWNRTSSPLKLKKGKYILSGCPKGGSANTYSLVMVKTAGDTYEIVANDFGEGAEFELTEDTNVGVLCKVWSSGVSLNENHTYYPMIRYASVEDGTFVPYVEDLDTRIGNGFGEATLWKPNVTSYVEQRCYYIKTKNTLKIWFCLYTDKEINLNDSQIICSNMGATFGINSNKFAWNIGLGINHSDTITYYNPVIASKENVLHVEYGGTVVPKGTTVYGFIETVINS